MSRTGLVALAYLIILVAFSAAVGLLAFGEQMQRLLDGLRVAQ